MAAEISAVPHGDVASPDQVIEWLDVAAADGWDTYRPLWLRLMKASGATIGVGATEMWPEVVINHRLEGAAAQVRAEYAACERMIDHLRDSGNRWRMLSYLIGDRDGTREDAPDVLVGKAVNTVVRDYIATEGRILIDPQGNLDQGQEIPDRYGRGDDAFDREAERATKAFSVATCCPRAVPAIKAVVQAFGRERKGGWRELKAGELSMEGAFTGWKAAVELINEEPDPDLSRDYAPAWAVHYFAEAHMLASEERSPRAAEILLWVLVDHHAQSKAGSLAVTQEDMSALVGIQEDAFDVGFACQALTALRGAREAAGEGWRVEYEPKIGGPIAC